MKVDRIYLERINHPVNEDFFDVFRVLEELPNRKFEIPIPVEASCPKDTSPEIPPISSDLKRKCGGTRTRQPLNELLITNSRSITTGDQEQRT